MWLFTTRGFVSVVSLRGSDRLLLVRSRFAGDIEALFPAARVRETPDADYRFRAAVPRATVADAAARAVDRIAYDNFKDACPWGRHGAYLRVWSAIRTAQGDLAMGGTGFYTYGRQWGDDLAEGYPAWPEGNEMPEAVRRTRPKGSAGRMETSKSSARARASRSSARRRWRGY